MSLNAEASPAEPDAVGDDWVRRSDFVIASWKKGKAVLQNYATGVEHDGGAAAFEILDLVPEWTLVADLRKLLPHRKAEEVRKTIGDLVEHTLLRSSGQPQHANERALARWSGWNPAVGFYHLSTKDVLDTTPVQGKRSLVTLRWHPEPLKAYPEAEGVELPGL